jgi:glucokinase
VFFGTGVGAAFIAGGELYVGASGAAGDLGHSLVAPMGPLTGSERQGVLDDFVGRNAIAGAAAAIAARGGAPYLFERVGADVVRIRSGQLAGSIRHGDKAVDEMVRSRARTAGIALSNIVDFLSPEMVVLGGGLVEAMPSLFQQEIEREILEHTVPAVARSVRVVVGKLGRHAVAAGAAKMAWDRVAPGIRAR